MKHFCDITEARLGSADCTPVRDPNFASTTSLLAFAKHALNTYPWALSGGHESPP